MESGERFDEKIKIVNIICNFSESEYRENGKKLNEESTDQKSEYDIMISCSREDKDLVNQIHQFLTDQGLHIWFKPDAPSEQGKSIFLYL